MLVKPPVWHTLRHRLCQPLPVLYSSSYKWPSRPPRKIRPNSVEVMHVMVVPSVAIVYSGSGCNVSSPKGSPTILPLQQTPSSTSCTQSLGFHGYLPTQYGRWPGQGSYTSIQQTYQKHQQAMSIGKWGRPEYSKKEPLINSLNRHLTSNLKPVASTWHPNST